MKKIIFRGIAFYIDGLFFSVLTFVLFFLHRYLVGDLNEHMHNFNSFILMPYHVLSYFVYFVLSEYFFIRTIGKKVFGFTVDIGEKKRGFNLFLKTIIRTIVRLIPFNQISFLFNDKQLCWHELWSGLITSKSKS